jgi:plastocyanin
MRQPKRIMAFVSAATVLAATFVLLAWMLARISEYPGVPRDLGALPSWFAGDIAPREPQAQRQAGATAPGVPEKSVSERHTGGAPALPKPVTSEGEYMEFASGQVEIVLREYELTPNKIRTRPGPVTFVLRNEGRFAHDFHVEGPGVDVHAEKFSPGRSIRVQVAMQEGEYKVSCPLSNHDQRGMHGTLIVTAKLAGQ